MSKKLLLKFWAPWCGPCKVLSATIAEANLEIDMIEINVDEKPEKASDYRIKSIPTLVLLDGANEIARTTGKLDIQELRRFVNQ